jgi:hypothetical protein
MRLKVIVYYLSYTRIHWSFVHVNMKPSEKLEIRGYIKVRCSLEITAEKILNEVHSHLGINSVSKSTVYRWFKAFTANSLIFVGMKFRGFIKMAIFVGS